VPKALASAHPGRSAARLAELVVEVRASGREAPEASQLAALAGVLGAGDFLADWLRERPEWAARLAGPAEAGPKPPRPVWSEIRDAHREGVLQIGSRSLLGAPVLETLHALSDLADGCVEAAVESAAGETGVAPPCVLAWGRFGAREVGLVWPLELLLVDPAPSDDARAERASECEVFAELLVEELPQQFEAGLTYALGPDGSERLPAPRDCVQSLSSAVAVWRARSGLHQHARLVALRQVAGTAGAGSDFIREIGLLLDRDARSPEEAGKTGASPSWRAARELDLGDPLASEADLLAGPCGVAVLERLVRGAQLRAGSRGQPGLRAAIEELPLGDRAPQRLAVAYTWLRRAELALGLLAAPSARIPDDSEGQLLLARAMGYAEPDAARALARFLYDWRAVRDELHETTDRLRVETNY
jgi:glutamine synthetase adenylyltransferase